MEPTTTHSFSIENTINPNNNEPFGAKYRGTFTIRRQSIYDKMLVSLKEASERNAFGIVNAGQIPPGIEMAGYIFHLVTTIATEPVPEWFDRRKIFGDDDEAAMSLVFEEVKTFQNSFRTGATGGSGGTAGAVA